MNIDGYGFHFEEQGRSGEEGPIDPSQQYFEGSHASDAVVRETGQNTLDNPGTDCQGPIRMEFELASMLTDDIPGIEQLRNHLDAVASQTKGQQGNERMMRAAQLAREREIQVLRISDYNTTGLTGSEALSSRDSPLSRLTRGKGGSADDERGGSFGIGSAVGPMASQLSTVLYTSLPEDGRQSVLAGYTRLATHELEGVSYRAEGYFTLVKDDDFAYLRPAPAIGPFAKRDEVGTDMYILGYRMAKHDPRLERIREALIDNFMAAIDRGHLVVEGSAHGNHWKLDSDTLEEYSKNRPESHAFYLALKDPTPAEEDLPHVGKVRLYVNIDDRLEKKLHTITMRKRLMKIDTFRHNSISAKYAAVLMCEEHKGNVYLRKLEPPQHHLWDAARDPAYGAAVVRSLKEFVRDALKERVSEELGDLVEIDGLARFLPTDSFWESESGDPATPTSNPGSEGTNDESSSVTGDPSGSASQVRNPSKKVQVKVRRPAVSDDTGDEDGEKGRDRGGENSRQRKGGPFSNSSSDGDGTSRIRGQELSFRSWSAPSNDADTAVIAVAITANSDESGDLDLVALGPGGEPEKSFELGISRAVLYGPNGEEDICVTGNRLKNITLRQGQMTRIDIHVPAGERYRLEAV